ncbi:IS1 family transposase [Xenorhabdus sp. PB61.4]|nr:IS1 family transposase [Xenorhabdus sp. PB61.4]
MATVEVICWFYHQTQTKDVKKHGISKSGHQRYRCLCCNRTFQLDYSYRACQAGIKEQVAETIWVSVILSATCISVLMLSWSLAL